MRLSTGQWQTGPSQRNGVICAKLATRRPRRRLGQCPANYEAASQLTPLHAELHFKLGPCALALNQFETARNEFTQARDLDTLPFRADSRINAILTAAARHFGGRGVMLEMDADQALAPLSVSGIPGEEVFHEHVHLNFEGNYQLARAFAGVIEGGLPASITHSAKSAWVGPADCARALGLTD